MQYNVFDWYFFFNLIYYENYYNTIGKLLVLIKEKAPDKFQFFNKLAALLFSIKKTRAFLLEFLKFCFLIEALPLSMTSTFLYLVMFDIL